MKFLPHWSALAAISILLSGITLATLVKLSNQRSVSTFGEVPDFSFVDQNGLPFTRSDLEGKIWIANFIFTKCAGNCPLMVTTMKLLAEGELPSNVKMVSFTVDPRNDTPSALHQYARLNLGNSDRWLLVTGEKDKIYRLSKEGFHLVVDDTRGTKLEPITHSNRFTLIDRTGKIRSYYDGTLAESATRILKDILYLVDEVD